MRIFAYVALCLFTLTFLENVHAEEADGSLFLRACGLLIKKADGGALSQEEDTLALFCSAYTFGFVDSMTLTAKFTKGKKNACIPEVGLANYQVARIFVKYLRSNPEILNESGRTSLYLALSRAFPCPK